MKLSGALDEDVARVRAVRAVFGDRLWLSVDGNGAYGVDDAIALAKALEPLGVARWAWVLGSVAVAWGMMAGVDRLVGRPGPKAAG